VSDDIEPPWQDRGLRVLTLTLLAVITVGSIFYTFVEHWDVLDAVYFSVVTLATVGYGDFAPKTAPGKVFTILYIVVGIGLLAAFANAFAKRWVDRRINRLTTGPRTTEDANGRRARRRFRRPG